MEQNSRGEELPLSNVNSATAGLSFSAAVIIYLVVSLIAGGAIAAAKLPDDSDGYLYLSYLVSPVAIAVSLFCVIKFKKLPVTAVFPVKCKPKYYLIALLLIFGLMFSLGWVNDVAVRFFSLFGYEARSSDSYLPDLSGAKIIPALFVIAVLPALLEEALFRGVILNCCQRGAGTVRTVFIVGMCFSLFHTSPEQTVYQFICGCLFALIALRSGSLLPSVAMHFVNNAVIVALSALELFDENGALLISDVGNIVLTALSAAALIGGAIWLILDRTTAVKAERGGVKAFFMYGAAAIAVLVILWICSFAGVG